MWTCPRCGRTFAARDQTHTCAPLGDVDAHFTRSRPAVREAYDVALDVVRALGPVEVLAEKSRIAWHVRMSFAAFQPRVSWLDGHLVLAREVPSPRWRRVETYSARNVLHAFPQCCCQAWRRGDGSIARVGLSEHGVHGVVRGSAGRVLVQE